MISHTLVVIDEPYIIEKHRIFTYTAENPRFGAMCDV